MKSFDLFQKVTVDNSSKSTIPGAVMSLMAISIMIFVLFKQLNEYFFIPLIEKETIIFQDEEMTSTVQVNIGLTFPKLPCSIISVDQEDLVGHHRLNIQDTLSKVPIDKYTVPNHNNYEAHQTSKLTESINNEDGCFLEGYIPISKVQGDIHISHHAYRDVYSYMIENGLSTKVSYSHKFTLFNFGNTEIAKKFLDRFQMREMFTSFNRVSNLPDYSKDDSGKDYDYYIKIIPQIFEDEYTGEKEVAYQYSLSSKKKDRQDEFHMPIIMINYDYSPVGVKYTMKKRYFSHLITDICALVGGVFVIFSILNGILNRISDSLDEDVNKNRRNVSN